MAAPTGNKIVLKTSTKMSLNERFTAYRQQAQNNLSSVRQRTQNQQQASLKNRRLAQQMANRPSVIAALKLKKRSMKQRLGQAGGGVGGGPGGNASVNTNIKSRLSLGGARQGVRSLKGRLGGPGPQPGRGKGYAIRGGIRRVRGGATTSSRPGMSPMLKGRLGIPTGSIARNRLRTNQGNAAKQGQLRMPRRGGFVRGRGGFNKNFRSQRGSFGGQPFRKGGRGMGSNRRGRGGHRAGGGGRQNNNRGRNNIPSKQELDNQLDEYMAKTKTHLDAELDAYMAETSSVIG